MGVQKQAKNPLKRGYSRRTLSANIAAEIQRGHDPSQAAAMAYKEARKWAEKAGKRPEYLYRQNPTDFLITAHNPKSGAVGYWTGKNWDDDPQFALRSHKKEVLKPLAEIQAKALPSMWKVSVRPAPDMPEPIYGKNPVPPSHYAKMKEAIELYTEFTGMEPDRYDSFIVEHPEVGFVVGTLDGVLYTTIREGKKESYVHEFKDESRPLLCCNFDGKQLIILGGEYQFTERGIVDR